MGNNNASFSQFQRSCVEPFRAGWIATKIRNLFLWPEINGLDYCQFSCGFWVRIEGFYNASRKTLLDLKTSRIHQSGSKSHFWYTWLLDAEVDGHFGAENITYQLSGSALNVSLFAPFWTFRSSQVYKCSRLLTYYQASISFYWKFSRAV